MGVRRAGTTPGRARPKVTVLASPNSSRGPNTPVASLSAAETARPVQMPRIADTEEALHPQG